LLVDTTARAFRERFGQLSARRREKLLADFRKLGIDAVDVETGRSFVEPLRRFFHQRGRRR
jgi:uncharacterized protein (DUF58 family)